MRRSLAPSQRNKNLGNPLPKFKSPLLKNTNKTTIINNNTHSIKNNITKLKEEVLEKSEINTSESEVLKENIGIEENKISTNAPPPLKKIKLSNYKRPLFTKKTPQLNINKNNNDNDNNNIEKEETSKKKLYFNVVWRKKTTKKNKTWEGDGILIVNGKSLLLKDEDGKDIAKGQDRNKSLDEGVILYLGQKEFEIMSELDEKQYTSGRCFLKLNDNLSQINNITPPYLTIQNKFKCPLTNKNKTKKSDIVPIPKYSIEGENAL
eukprot:jgi/Orpsp1_1/1175955/evm.model.c7180000055856.1